MRGGKLRTPLHLQRPVIGTDGSGAPTVTWPAAFPDANAWLVWADVAPLTGREFVTTEIHGPVDLRIKIRRAKTAPPMPDATWRFYDPVRNLPYAIVAVLPSPKNDEIILMCKTPSGGGDGR